MRYKPSLEHRDHGWNESKPSPGASIGRLVDLGPVIKHGPAAKLRAARFIRRHARSDAEWLDLLAMTFEPPRPEQLPPGKRLGLIP